MKTSDPEVIKQLLADLRHYSKEVRRTAVIKLGMVGGDEALRALILTVGNNNEDLIVRGRAALMLGKLGDPVAVESLIRALDAPGFQTPFYAAQSLGKLGDARAIEPLLNMLHSSNDKVRQAALESLERLGYDIADEDKSPALEGEES
ncbi:MAG: HEAT repeat domain-containing protein [Chloroflexi bacterium]|nr:MAG: HEAT repeat domain-containing protein [Chloroflexota bacterium]